MGRSGTLNYLSVSLQWTAHWTLICMQVSEELWIRPRQTVLECISLEQRQVRPSSEKIKKNLFAGWRWRVFFWWFDGTKAVLCPAWASTNCCFTCNIQNGWLVILCTGSLKHNIFVRLWIIWFFPDNFHFTYLLLRLWCLVFIEMTQTELVREKKNQKPWVACQRHVGSYFRSIPCWFLGDVK